MKAKNSFRAFVFLATAILMSLLWLPAQPLSGATAPEPLAAVAATADLVTFQPLIPYDQVRVTVAGPGDFEIVATYSAAEIPAVALPGTDGLYKYELRFTPVIDPGQRERLRTERAAGGDLRSHSAADRQTVQRGWFRLDGGGVVANDLRESGSTTQATTALGPIQQVVLSNGDGVIRNSLCVGFDCPDAPIFDDSTILLMENNTRIKFGDTSNAPFPNNDWEIEANSNLSGGLNYLGFNDCGNTDNDGGCATDLVFAVESGARASALYVEDDGDVGIGTSLPVLDLHIVTGNTPALRLDQDGSSGFAPQVWDIAANEANFFVRDVTGGSRLPLRIRPGAPTSSIDIAGDGDVGINTTLPAAQLHVLNTQTGRTDGVIVLAESNKAEQTFARVLNSNAANQIVGVSFVNNSGKEWRFQEGAAGAVFNITRVGSGGNEITVNQRLDGAGPATLVVDGSVQATNVTFPSSRELKTDFQALDVQDVLARVTGLEMTSWRFKEGPAVRHIGPIAEDFHAAFPLAPTNKMVSSIDVSGVALAAIQGLNQELNQELQERDATIRDLLERVAALEAMLAP